MAEPTIDAAAFAELQQSAGAEFVCELVDTFLEEAPAMFTELDSALDARDSVRFQRVAHTLKSNANTFGAFTFGALARDLELTGFGSDSAADRAAVAAALEALASEYARVVLALKALCRV